MLHRGEGLRRNVVVLHRGVATVHSMEIFVFCFVFYSIILRTFLLD